MLENDAGRETRGPRLVGARASVWGTVDQGVANRITLGSRTRLATRGSSRLVERFRLDLAMMVPLVES